jgi:hypothetical protein
LLLPELCLLLPPLRLLLLPPPAASLPASFAAALMRLLLGAWLPLLSTSQAHRLPAWHLLLPVNPLQPG